MNAFELIFFCAAAYAGHVLGRWAQHHLGWVGYPVGFLAGAALALVCLSRAIPWLLDMAYVGRPRFPTCRNGKCRAEDYTLKRWDTIAIWHCQCGDRYCKRRRRFYQVQPNGSCIPYMVWRPFRGWIRDYRSYIPPEQPHTEMLPPQTPILDYAAPPPPPKRNVILAILGLGEAFGILALMILSMIYFGDGLPESVLYPGMLLGLIWIGIVFCVANDYWTGAMATDPRDASAQALQVRPIRNTLPSWSQLRKRPSLFLVMPFAIALHLLSMVLILPLLPLLKLGARAERNATRRAAE